MNENTTAPACPELAEEAASQNFPELPNSAEIHDVLTDKQRWRLI